MPESSQKNSDIRAILVKYAANILSRRPYFSHRLREKIINYAKTSRHSGLDPESIQIIPIVEDILKDLQGSGYLNDSYLAEAFVRRCLGKGQGPKLIKYKLTQLGLSAAAITSALSTPENQELLEQVKAKIASKYASSDPYMVKSKLYQRGF